MLIVNSHISLEPVKYSHAFIVFEAIMQNKTFLSEWLPFVNSTENQEDTENFIRSVLNSKKEKIFVIWFDNHFAGLIGLKDIDSINQKLEIGYWLIEKMTHKGIMRQSVKSLINYSFMNLNMNRIQIKCAVGNHKSSAIPKNLGFIFEGIERNGEKHGTRFLDLEMYSLIKKEWQFL
jgi:Acetyltransferases, including N-acetylases of ribosomal proteins